MRRKRERQYAVCGAGDAISTAPAINEEGGSIVDEVFSPGPSLLEVPLRARDMRLSRLFGAGSPVAKMPPELDLASTVSRVLSE